MSYLEYLLDKVNKFLLTKMYIDDFFKDFLINKLDISV